MKLNLTFQEGLLFTVNVALTAKIIIRWWAVWHLLTFLIPIFGLCASVTEVEVWDASIVLVAHGGEDALAKVQAANHHLFKLQITIWVNT